MKIALPNVFSTAVAFLRLQVNVELSNQRTQYELAHPQVRGKIEKPPDETIKRVLLRAGDGSEVRDRPSIQLRASIVKTGGDKNP